VPLAAAALAAPTAHAAAASSPRPIIPASRIAHRLAAGKPVSYQHVIVRGSLRLPPTVAAPLSLRNSIVRGDISGRSTDFRNLVDLSGTRVRGDVDFYNARFDGPLLMLGKPTSMSGLATFAFASFGGPAVFAQAHFEAASFAGCQFHGEGRFERVTFDHATTFAFAGFDHTADFTVTNFDGPVSFARVEFHSPADFSYVDFGDAAVFDGARFFAAADFTAASFSDQAPRASFSDAHLGGGTVFNQATFGNGASFANADASGEVSFEGATMQGGADFSNVRFPDRADFDQADFSGAVTFDQAQLSELDFDGADLATSQLTLPGAKHSLGRLEQLRMDPVDVARVRLGPERQVRQVREQALALIEATARTGGDLRAAAEAGVRRRSLGRQDEWPPLQPFDWLFYWQIGGYLLRPLHPLFAIVTLILLAALIRSRRHRSKRTGFLARSRGFLLDLLRSIAAVWRGAGQTLPARIESVIQKILYATLALSIANVWPPVAALLKGVFP
jgi:uncharacterized protein YjbI with pentapeptide repeats